MSDYGIEIYNSLGELVFSSDKRTVQVLKAGHFSLPFDLAGISIEFPPVSERPQIYAQTSGRFNVRAENIRYWDPFGTGGYLYNITWWLTAPAIGPFVKNEEGKYYRISIFNGNMLKMGESLGSPVPGNHSGEEFLNIPYVIFV